MIQFQLPNCLDMHMMCVLDNEVLITDIKRHITYTSSYLLNDFILNHAYFLVLIKDESCILLQKFLGLGNVLA